MIMNMKTALCRNTEHSRYVIKGEQVNLQFKKEIIASFLKYYMVILRDIKHNHRRKTVNTEANVEQAKAGKGREEGEEVRERTVSKLRLRLRKSLVVSLAFVAGTAKKPVRTEVCVPRQAGCQSLNFTRELGAGGFLSPGSFDLPVFSVLGP